MAQSNVSMDDFKVIFRKIGDKMNKRGLKFYIILCAILTVVNIAYNLYFGFVRFSIYSTGMRGMIFMWLLIWTIPYFVVRSRNRRRAATSASAVFAESSKKKNFAKKMKPQSTAETVFFCFLTALVAVTAIIIILNIVAMPLFSANTYRLLIDVDVSENNNIAAFTSDVEDYSEMKVPIVDKNYAALLGDKRLGEEVGLGSQFRVDNYTMIEHGGELYWVGALEHSTFFTWGANTDGVPGYIRVSATDPSIVDYIRVPGRMKYVPSAFFGQNLHRKLYFSNMGKVTEDRVSFELDDNGNPMYVFSVVQKKIALTQGNDTVGIITLDPISGNSQYYDIAQIPSWVNHAYTTEQVNNQLDWWGHYVHGFWNSVFGKREVMQISDGYNYVYNKGDFYLYTGLTSVGDDESIVGVVLVNLRTKASTKLYHTGGATEYAAARAAQGVFQADRFSYTYPLLVNYHGTPTYLILLKDDMGFVKQYVFVQLRDPSKYGSGSDLRSAELNYQTNSSIVTENQKINVTITDIATAVKNGNQIYFIKVDGDSKIFEAVITLSTQLPFLKVGDVISFTYTGTFIQALTVSTGV